MIPSATAKGVNMGRGKEMRTYRTQEEALQDKAWVLMLASRVQRQCEGEVGDRLKLQKLCFLSTYPLFRERVKASNLTFFTYRWGPFTKDLYEVETDFEEAGLMSRDGKGQFYLEESGCRWGDLLYEEARKDPENSRALDHLDDVVEKHGIRSTRYLVDFTHEMKVVPVGWSSECEEDLDDLPLFLDLTLPIDVEEATAIFEIEEATLESFAYALQPEEQEAYEVAT